MIKSISIIFSLILLPCGRLIAQEVTALSLLEAYELLEKRYPILQNEAIEEAIHQKSLAQLDKTRKPNLYWKADGQVQTGSVSLETAEGVILPFEINQPIFNTKTYLEGQYLMKDGGLLAAQKQFKSTALQASKQQYEVERFGLRQRVNVLAVNINLLRAQAELFDISLEDVASSQTHMAALVDNGIQLESELTKLAVKELELKAQKDNVLYKLVGLTNSLSDLLGIALKEDFSINFPVLGLPTRIPALNRPETTLFQLQREAILANSAIIDATQKPQLSAFAQAGVGYPNPLNFLKNDVAPYGVAGVRFSWKITDWKKSELDKELLSLQALQLDNAEANFRFNMDTQKASYLSEVDRIQAQIEHDKNIAELQATILQQSAAQLEEGTITTTEYLLQVNAELKARQNLSIHQTELLQLQLEYWNERGGF